MSAPSSGSVAKLDSQLERLAERHQELREALAETGRGDYAQLAKEFAALTPLVQEIEQRRDIIAELASLDELATNPATDGELRSLADEEGEQLRAKLLELEGQIQQLLKPKAEADHKNVILELRAGTGGEEAALFAAQLFEMYRRYALLQGWRFEVMGLSMTSLSGVKQAVAEIRGRDVFARLKFESGVHRVQRIPQTETNGRVHTSAATVAILPEPEEVDIRIDEKDLRVDVFRASGPGGQSVNTTDSAVRITHLPTGVVVSQQDEKSQHKNKNKAMKILRARLYERERAASEIERSQQRRSQIGSGDRSERIRTYNFPQGRVSDHRINLTLYKIDRIITGEALNEIIEPLLLEAEAARLSDGV